MAGRISYLAPVDNASGKIFGQKQQFIAVTRKYGKKQRGCSVQGERNYNTHPVTSKESAIRLKFTAVAEAVRARQIDPTKMAADQAAFVAQTKYKRMWGFLWNLEWEAYQA